jgi:hypothetical protein
MTVLTSAVQMLPGQLKPRTLRVIKLDILLEIGSRMAVRASLLMKNRPELTDVNVFMAVHAELLFKALEFINRFFPAAMTVLAGCLQVFSGKWKTRFRVIEL